MSREDGGNGEGEGGVEEPHVMGGRKVVWGMRKGMRMGKGGRGAWRTNRVKDGWGGERVKAWSEGE